MTLKKDTTTFNKNLNDHGRRTADDEKLTPDAHKTLKDAPYVDADHGTYQSTVSSDKKGGFLNDKIAGRKDPLV